MENRRSIREIYRKQTVCRIQAGNLRKICGKLAKHTEKKPEYIDIWRSMLKIGGICRKLAEIMRKIGGACGIYAENRQHTEHRRETYEKYAEHMENSREICGKHIEYAENRQSVRKTGGAYRKLAEN